MPCSTRDDMEEGKVPTVSTTASVIAGIQCQEAVKLIHGLDVLAGRGFVFEGMTHSSYVVAYTRKDDCPAHDPDEPVRNAAAEHRPDPRAGDFLERVRSDLGPEAVIETGSDSALLALLPPLPGGRALSGLVGQGPRAAGALPQVQGAPHAEPLPHASTAARHSSIGPWASWASRLWDVLGGRCGPAAGVLRICRRPRGGLGNDCVPGDGTTGIQGS